MAALTVWATYHLMEPDTLLHMQAIHMVPMDLAEDLAVAEDLAEAEDGGKLNN